MYLDKTGGELWCYERVRSSCPTSGTRRVTLVRKPVISHKKGKKGEIATTTNRTYIWSSVTPIFLSRDGCRKLSK
jgi:hypothetical protein